MQPSKTKKEAAPTFACSTSDRVGLMITPYFKICKKIFTNSKICANVIDTEAKLWSSEKTLSSVMPHENKNCTITKGDSAASNYYFTSHDKKILNNLLQ